MSDFRKKLITMVVPCFNERETVGPFVDTIEPIVEKLHDRYETRIVFVNDGSHDDTLDLIKGLAATHPDIRYVSFSRNFGKEIAVYAGLMAAQAMGSDAAIPMDVDLQDPPYLIPEFVKWWERGYEYIYGHFDSRKGQNFIKKTLSSEFYRVYSHLTGDKLIRSGDRDYALMDKKVLKAFVDIKDKDRFNRGIADFVGFKRKEIVFPYVNRTKGKTKYSLRKMIRYALSSFREFGTLYLLVPESFIALSLVGIVAFSVLGGLGIGWWDYLPIGLCSLTLSISILSYFHMKLQYQAREETRKRPIYIVSETNVEGIDR